MLTVIKITALDPRKGFTAIERTHALSAMYAALRNHGIVTPRVGDRMPTLALGTIKGNVLAFGPLRRARSSTVKLNEVHVTRSSVTARFQLLDGVPL